MDQKKLPTLSDVTHFVSNLFMNREKSDPRITTVTHQTPYSELAHTDINFCLHQIEQEFGIKRFDLICHLSSNEYYGLLGEHEAAFNAKFPECNLFGRDFTLERLCLLIHELVTIAWVQDQNRFTLDQLNELSAGLGDQVNSLIEIYYRNSATYYDFQKASKRIEELLDDHGLTPDNIIIDKGPAATLPLAVDFKRTAFGFQFADQFDM